MGGAGRLAEIEKDLHLRRKRAQEEHWLGEVEGIGSTLTFLRAEQAEAARLTKRPTTDLGIPRPRPDSTGAGPCYPPIRSSTN
ncbi:recombinase [Streptomyces sp. NBC_01590]|uniref:recombinase n=1 Tax=Streptomyces sp. NBC_01590 TaxID=2975887 RepID=UPI003867BDA6